jgi:hypothetical protein
LARERAAMAFSRAREPCCARERSPRVLPPAIVIPSRPAMTQRRARKTNNVTSFWIAALGTTCDPNGHADADRCPRVRSVTQTAKTDYPAASVWVGWRCLTVEAVIPGSSAEPPPAGIQALCMHSCIRPAGS